MMNACNSILSQLLLNNRPPGPLETGSLQAEVNRLKGKINGLRTKLQEYEDLLQKHQTVLSIARRVPLDVLGIIFSFVLPDCSTRKDWQELTSLSMVCKDWHQAAQFSHRFSSHLKLFQTKVDYDNVTSWSRRATEGRVRQIIGSSCDCPTHHRRGDEATTSECTFAGSALLRLMAEGPVLDHLRFKTVKAQCYQHFLDLFASSDASSNPRPWDTLKKFTLHFAPEETRSRLVTAIGPESIGVPPCITSLDLELPDSVQMGANSPPLLIQPGTFQRLTSFSVKWDWSRQDGKMLLAALAHCGNLETLVLNFDCCRWFCTNGYGSKVVTLPKLRNLKLARPQGEFKVLSFINAPALTHLDVHVREEVKPDILSSFITQRVTRSQDALHVSLSITYGQDWDIPKFLSRVPYVTHLKLDRCLDAPKNCKTGADFFYFLGLYKNALSHLKVLEIVELPPEIPLSTIEQYIDLRRRERADDGLKTLIVNYNSVWLPESCKIGTAQLVEKLRNKGLSIDIEYPKFLRNKLMDMYK